MAGCECLWQCLKLHQLPDGGNIFIIIQKVAKAEERKGKAQPQQFDRGLKCEESGCNRERV